MKNLKKIARFVKNQKMSKNFQKAWIKIVQNSINLRVFSERLFVSS